MTRELSHRPAGRALADRPWLPAAVAARVDQVSAAFAGFGPRAALTEIDRLVAENHRIHDDECLNLNPATNVMNPRAEVERKDEFRPTLVKRGATIGANATIVCGVTLGSYCFIGAGAVVTRDVPAFALMVGSPARRIGWMSHDGERLGSDLVCRRSSRRYREAGPDQLEEVS